LPSIIAEINLQHVGASQVGAAWHIRWRIRGHGVRNTKPEKRRNRQCCDGEIWLVGLKHRRAVDVACKREKRVRTSSSFILKGELFYGGNRKKNSPILTTI